MCTATVAACWGFLALTRGVEINDITSTGTQVLFVDFPNALSLLPSPSVWSLLFYLFIFLLVCNVMFALTEVFITALVDQFPQMRKYKPLVALVVCVVSFLLGLPLCTNTGFDILIVLDFNLATHQPHLMVLCMVCCFVYYAIISKLRYRHDMAAISKWVCCCCRSLCLWIMCSVLLASAVLVSLFLLVMFGIEFADRYWPEKPTWANRGFQISLLAFPLVALVVAFILHIFVTLCRKGMNVADLFKVSKNWRPTLENHKSRLHDPDNPRAKPYVYNTGDINAPYLIQQGLPQGLSKGKSKGKSQGKVHVSTVYVADQNLQTAQQKSGTSPFPYPLGGYPQTGQSGLQKDGYTVTQTGGYPQTGQSGLQTEGYTVTQTGGYPQTVQSGLYPRL